MDRKDLYVENVRRMRALLDGMFRQLENSIADQWRGRYEELQAFIDLIESEVPPEAEVARRYSLVPPPAGEGDSASSPAVAPAAVAGASPDSAAG